MIWNIIAVIVGVVLVLVIGCIRLWLQIRDTKEDRQFAVDYLNYFQDFTTSYYKNDFDGELYNWLVLNSALIQHTLGILGVLEFHQPPFSNVAFRNWPAIENTLPLFVDGSIERSEVANISFLLTRYVGVQNYKIAQQIKQIRNPFVWFRVGVSSIVILPVRILSWFGFFGEHTVGQVEGNPIFKLLAALASLVGLGAAIIEAVNGWEQFVKIMNGIFHP